MLVLNYGKACLFTGQPCPFHILGAARTLGQRIFCDFRGLVLLLLLLLFQS